MECPFLLPVKNPMSTLAFGRLQAPQAALLHTPRLRSSCRSGPSKWLGDVEQMRKSTSQRPVQISPTRGALGSTSTASNLIAPRIFVGFPIYKGKTAFSMNLGKPIFKTTEDYPACAMAASSPVLIDFSRDSTPLSLDAISTISGDLIFRVLSRKAIPQPFLEQCAQLFSSAYGVWGQGAGDKRVGKRVRMSTERMCSEFLFDDNCYLVVAMTRENIIGHAFCRRFFHQPLQGTVVWITQLVVDPLLRRRRIATRLLQNAVNSRFDVAIGLVTSHPHSVRALEMATGRLVVPALLKTHAEAIIQSSQVPYISNRKMHGFNINTEFYIDHSEVNYFLSQEQHWLLGPLREGEEFVAITFFRGHGMTTGKEADLVVQRWSQRQPSFLLGFILGVFIGMSLTTGAM